MVSRNRLRLVAILAIILVFLHLFMDNWWSNRHKRIILYETSRPPEVDYTDYVYEVKDDSDPDLFIRLIGPDITYRPILSSSNSSTTNQVPIKPSLFKSNRGCKMPVLPLKNAGFEEYETWYLKQKKMEPVNCLTDQEMDWLIVRNEKIIFSDYALETYKDTINCTINYMERIDDWKQHKSNVSFALSSNGNQSLVLQDDFFYGDCNGINMTGSNNSWSIILPGVHKKQQVIERYKYYITKNLSIDHENEIDDTILSKRKLREPVNVLVFGFDSTSHVSFRTKLPKTYSYLKNNLSAIILNNYNIVGDGTTHNLLPLWSGKYIEDLPEVRWSYSHTTLDSFPFAFKDYINHGYVTVYTEDVSKWGTFQYRLNGFKDPPVDHYARPFNLEIENYHDKKKVWKDYCLGSRKKIQMMTEWIEEFYDVYPFNFPKLIFGFHSEYSHDYYEKIRLADDDTLDWLQGMKKRKRLDSTILFVMSDHGHRMSSFRRTVEGKLEERMPFFSVILPDWFKEKFPKSYRALKMNGNDRLITPFDIHETLLSILKDINEGVDVGVNPHPKENMDRGLNIFREIAIERTCQDARIKNHFCACSQWTSCESSEREKQLIERGVDEVINRFNSLVKDSNVQDKCHQIKLNKINRCFKMTQRQEILSYVRSLDGKGREQKVDNSDTAHATQITFEFQFETNPGNALFEATTIYFLAKDSFQVDMDQVSRVNMYGDSPKCVRDQFPHLRPYCYCKNG